MRSSSLLVCVAFFLFLSNLQTVAQQHSARGDNADSAPSGSTNAGPCTNRKLTVYPASPNSTGDTIEGGACVEATPVNRLRYFIYISTTITQTAGPSPGSISPAMGSEGVFAPPREGFTAPIVQLQGQVTQLESDFQDRHEKNRTVAAKLDGVLARLKEFIVHSDEQVLGGNLNNLVTEIQNQKNAVDDISGNKLEWHNTEDILSNILNLQKELARIDAPAIQDKVKALKGTLDDLKNKALLQASGSDQAKAIGVKNGLLRYWSGVLGSFLNPDGSVPADPTSKFVVHQDVPCSTLFNVNKETAVKLTVGDRLPFFDGQLMSTQTRDAFVTVKCSSPFSVSAGVAFSLIEQREFAIQPTPPPPESDTPINKFGYSSRSNVNPAPMAMAHMRLHDWDKHRYALHASFGVGVNVQGTNGGGSSAEYLPGVSLSLFRTMYLTAGVSIAKQADLAGFAVNTDVPATVTAPPIRTSYKAGAGFAITFTKP